MLVSTQRPTQQSHLQVHQVDDDTSSSVEEWLNTVGSGRRDLKCRKLVGGKVTFQIERGFLLLYFFVPWGRAFFQSFFLSLFFMMLLDA